MVFGTVLVFVGPIIIDDQIAKVSHCIFPLDNSMQLKLTWSECLTTFVIVVIGYRLWL